MVITKFKSGISIKSQDWAKASDILCTKEKIFDTQYKIFILCASIGIRDDRVVFITNQSSNEYSEENNLGINIPYFVLNNHIDDYKILFQITILTSKHIDLNDDNRIDLAFGNPEVENITLDGHKMSVYRLLEPYANYGVKELVKFIDKMKNPDDMDILIEIEDYFNSMINNEF